MNAINDVIPIDFSSRIFLGSYISMLELTITITGKSTSDLEFALEEVTRKVSEGYLSGMDSNDEGDYSFKVTGEEE